MTHHSVYFAYLYKSFYNLNMNNLNVCSLFFFYEITHNGLFDCLFIAYDTDYVHSMIQPIF